MPQEIIIGSRESALALIQTNHIKDTLTKLYPNIKFSINSMTTTGDQIQTVSLNKIGTKALFTKELEVALLQKTCHFVVHSLKDLPTTLPEGMILSTITARKDPRDSVIMSIQNKGKTLKDLKDGSVIGTSSVRRIAQLKRAFPNLMFKDIRGNLNTRYDKYLKLG
jgi:hydroxymethylbilane synthase